VTDNYEVKMRRRNTVHIQAKAGGLFDIEIFPLDTYSTIKEKGLSAAQVVDRLLAGPETVEILSFDETERPVNYHEAVQAEMRSRGKSFVSSQPCGRCGDSRLVNGGPCPACSVPWK